MLAALAMEPPEPGRMSRPRRSHRPSILSWPLGWAILFRGLLLAAVSLAAFAFLLGPADENV